MSYYYVKKSRYLRKQRKVEREEEEKCEKKRKCKEAIETENCSAVQCSAFHNNSAIFNSDNIAHHTPPVNINLNSDVDISSNNDNFNFNFDNTNNLNIPENINLNNEDVEVEIMPQNLSQKLKYWALSHITVLTNKCITELLNLLRSEC